MAGKKNKNGRRVDNRGRVLKDGEMQRTDGRYMYGYTSEVTGERKFIYSWKLEKNDPMPKGKKPEDRKSVV